MDESRIQNVAACMQKINRAWLEGRVNDMAPMIHPDIVMVFPGFAGRTAGREVFLDGFRQFLQDAVIHEFREKDAQVDAVSDTAVVNFCYEMMYERSGGRYRATGRDLWIFRNDGVSWLAVWRTMLDMQENAA